MGFYSKHNYNPPTDVVKYLTAHLNDCNDKVCNWLTEYIHTSCGVWVDKKFYQPAIPKAKVVSYIPYHDDKFHGHYHHRFSLLLDNGGSLTVSIWRFKRYLRRVYYFNDLFRV